MDVRAIPVDLAEARQFLVQCVFRAPSHEGDVCSENKLCARSQANSNSALRVVYRDKSTGKCVGEPSRYKFFADYGGTRLGAL